MAEQYETETLIPIKINNILNSKEPVLVNWESPLGEKMYVCVNQTTPSESDRGIIRESYEADITDSVTVTVYAEGNGILHPEGEMVVVGFSNAAILEDYPGVGSVLLSEWNVNNFVPEEGEYVINTSHMDGSSLNTQRVTVRSDDEYSLGHWKSLIAQNSNSDPEALSRFEKALEESEDIYRGVGNIMQAIMIGYMIRNSTDKMYVGVLLGVDAIKYLERWGIDSSESGRLVKVDTNVAYPKMIEVADRFL